MLAHARALLDSHKSDATEYIDADLRDTDTISRHSYSVICAPIDAWRCVTCW